MRGHAHQFELCRVATVCLGPLEPCPENMKTPYTVVMCPKQDLGARRPEPSAVQAQELGEQEQMADHDLS